MKSFIKFVPVIILAFLMAFMKEDALIAAPIATIAAMIACSAEVRSEPLVTYFMRALKVHLRL